MHKPGLWNEIQDVIENVDSALMRTKVSKEVRTMEKLLHSPIAMNAAMSEGFKAKGWGESRTSYWVTSDAKLIRKTMQMEVAQQKAEIEAAGFKPIFSYNQTDFVKERVAVEVQFGKYSFVAYDLFVMGLLRCDSGSAQVFGRPIIDADRSVERRRRIGFVTKDKELYPYMTVEQLIRFTRPFFPKWRHDLDGVTYRCSSCRHGESFQIFPRACGRSSCCYWQSRVEPNCSS